MAGSSGGVGGDGRRLDYLPGLDGLRAIAVVAVVAYHLDLPWAAGGFLGVDLFFVISGYLITSLLVGELDREGRLDLPRFWLRRVRRLVPPVVVMVAVTLLATRWWGLPEQWDDIRIDAAASIGYVANWWFVVSDQSYFESFLGPSPLRHMWSLAVEEQWYLVWPIAVVAMGGLLAGTRRRRVVALAAILVAAVSSAIWMAVLYTPGDPSRVYFGTDTRAQQLLVGAALAVALPLVPRLGRLVASPAALAVSLSGWVLVAATTPDDAAWLYRGGLLAVSMLCATVVAGVATATSGPLHSAVGSAPMRWLGHRSYGVYLWHWPVIIFVGPPMGLELADTSLAVLQVTVTIVLAELSYRMVERPARTSARPAWSVALAWSTAGVAVVLIGLVVLAPTDRRLPTETVLRPAELQTEVADVPPTDPGVSDSAPTVPVPDTVPTVPVPDTDDTSDVPAVVADDPSPPPDSDATVAVDQSPPRRLLLLGDSTALVAGLRPPDDPDLAADWSIDTFAQLGCALSDGQTVDVGEETLRWNPEACADFRTDWFASVEAVQPDVAVVMVGAWEVFDHVVDGRRLSFPEAAWVDHVGGAIAETVARTAAPGRTVALLELPCMQEVDSGIEVATARLDDRRVAAFNAILEGTAAASPDVVVLPLGDLLCPAGETARGTDGEHLRYDGVHLTPAGVDAFWTWLFDELGALDR